MSNYEFWDDLGKIFNAVMAYQEKTLEFNKLFITPWIRLGNVFEKQDRSTETIIAYRKAIELDPANAQNWYELGNAFFQREEYQDAADAYNQAAKLDPDQGWAYNNLAFALVKQGKYAEAVPLYQKSIERLKDDKDKAVAWNRLGNVYRKLDEYASALDAFQRADDLDEQNAGFRDELDEVADVPSLVEGNRSEPSPVTAETAAGSAPADLPDGVVPANELENNLPGVSDPTSKTAPDEAQSSPDVPEIPAESGHDIPATIADDPSGATSEATGDAAVEILASSEPASEPAEDSPQGIDQAVTPVSVESQPDIPDATKENSPVDTTEKADDIAVEIPASAEPAQPPVVDSPEGTDQAVTPVSVESQPDTPSTTVDDPSGAAPDTAGNIAVESSVSVEPAQAPVADPSAETDQVSANAAAVSLDAMEPEIGLPDAMQAGTDEGTQAADPVQEPSQTQGTPIVVDEQNITNILKNIVDACNSSNDTGEVEPLNSEAGNVTVSIDSQVVCEMVVPAIEDADMNPLPLWMESATSTLNAKMDAADHLEEEIERTAAGSGLDGDAERPANWDIEAAEEIVAAITQATEGNVSPAHAAYEEFLEDNGVDLHIHISEEIAVNVENREPEASQVPVTKITPSGELQIEVDTKNAYVWNEMGNVYFNTNAYDDAIAAYRKAIELDRQFAWPYSNLALAYVKKRRFVEAILFYQRSIELFSNGKDKAVSWNRLGNVYRLLNDYDSAISAYQKADELDSDNTLLSMQSRFGLLGNYFTESKPSYIG